MSRRFTLSWLLVFSLLAQSFVPVLAQQPASAVNFAYKSYTQAYEEYVSSVNSKAPVEEVKEKLAAYLDAQNKYRKLAGHGPANETLPETSSPRSQQTIEAGGQQSQAPPSGALSSEEVKEAENAKRAWYDWRNFKSKIVDNGLRLLGGASNPGEMPLWERIAWTIGKALLPTMGVMIATALLAPLTPLGMIIGGIVTGASLAGAMTYAFEKRMNAKYREVPKEEAKIWRDVSVQATVEAVMTPFNLATGGLFGMIGPSAGNAIGKVALTQATLTFAGRMFSSQIGGGVKNLWAKHYFKYPEKIEANERRIDEILASHLASNKPFSEETLSELDRLRAEINTMKGEQYSEEDALKDMKRAGISAMISGFAGSIASDKAYNSAFGRWSDRASVKLFGNVARGKTISSLFSTMPVNFGSGMANAALEKSFINEDISDLLQQQNVYPRGSPVWQYYERIISEKTAKKDSIDVTKAGFDSMMNSFAIHAARLTVDAIKHNVYDGPKARKAAVEKLYREKEPEWQKANQLQVKYEQMKNNGPSPLKFRNPADYARAVINHKRALNQARSEWLNQVSVAQSRADMPANVAMKKQIKTDYERDVKLSQMLELGRLRGGEAHLEAMKKVLQSQNPELANASDAKMNELAALAIKKTYVDKFTSSTNRSKEIEETFDKRRKYKSGKLELSAEEAKLLTGKAAVISPSQYKAALVEKYVYELKANNMRWSDVDKRMPHILERAEKEMLSQYDNNWGSVLYHEAYANGLARYKYNPEGYVNFGDEMKKLAKKIPQMVRSNVLGEYTKEVNKAITSNVIPQTSSDGADRYLAQFGKTAINDATGKVINTVYDASSEQIVSGFFK
jgi:hypothetical protein